MQNTVTNIIKKDTLRRVQMQTLNELKESLMKSFGPYGSNTIIYDEKGLPRYTKDGHTILGSIQFAGMIEKSVKADIEEETRTQALKVGDSTTSITILSAIIFEKLIAFEMEYEDKIPPADIVKTFKNVVDGIKENIKSKGREATIEDLYNIALISTNGNEKLSEKVRDIYESYGLDVFIDVKASMTGESYEKKVDGMVLEYGYMDTTFVNNPTDNTSELKNPRIYAFEDPIDTIEMGTYLDKILIDNIINPCQIKDYDNIIPTVIIAPRISKDFSSYMDTIIKASANNSAVSRFPINIITNIESCDFDAYDDIRELCGCKYIKKYLDPAIQERDIAMGLAVDVTKPETLHEMAGSASMVISSNDKTTFINPIEMYAEDNSGDFSAIFNAKLAWLNSEIEKLKVQGNNTLDIYNLKKRLNSLKGNMVEIYIGGVTVADRDQERDLMEDAILNCRSAVKSGVGFGANYEGLIACSEMYESDTEVEVTTKNRIINILFEAYLEISRILYSSVDDSGFDVQDIINTIISGDNVGPFNLRTKNFDKKVLSSIDTDISVLDTISKIITIMATSNQLLLPNLNINQY